MFTTTNIDSPSSPPPLWRRRVKFGKEYEDE